MTARELRKKFVEFFVAKGHKEIPSASLIPENDPSVLFTSAGMHPLVPYLLGEPHPLGKRLVDVQKCLRTDDIDNVGDGFHHTFFEMLGNWSLGDYFKKEAIAWSFEFLTSPQWLGLDPQKIYVTVFAGDTDAPRDEESIAAWQEQFATKSIEAKVGERIFPFGKKENWWGPVGNCGPCGPDSEMFFDTGKPKCSDKCDPSCQCGKYVEIWNDVFMQYTKTPEGKYEPLAQKTVDTGMGVDRVTAVTSGFGDDNYRTELFAPLIQKIEELSGKKYGGDEDITRSMRIVADHLRAAVFVLGDGITPSNKDQGYILRRLIRKAVRGGRSLGIISDFSAPVAEVIIQTYTEAYPDLVTKQDMIVSELEREEEKFSQTLATGLHYLEKELAPHKLFDNAVGPRPLPLGGGELAFNMQQTYGFPPEMTLEELKKVNRIRVDEVEYWQNYHEFVGQHQEKSRAGSEQKFVGGLVDHSEQTARLHTATHLLQAALRQVLGSQVEQRGSNITPERLRFDFSYATKLTEEQLRRVEEIVNNKIRADLPVTMEMVSLEEAKKRGAMALFTEKYGEQVKLYSITDFSIEVCGGPHMRSTGELKSFKIIKEEAVGQGVRRIKAVIG
ncbi:MAG: alanine--tRNA ligase [bacterium]|nr:alanine--tRNA ligase [bacterium]